MDIININCEKIENEERGKAKYKVENNEVFVEEAVIYNYQQNGYKAMWSENDYWWHLMGLLFWDIIFAKIEGAVKVSVNGFEEELSPSINPIEFNRYFEWTINNNGMPSDFFTNAFYKNRQMLIKNRIKELLNSDIEDIVIKSYNKHYGKNFRMIENWNRFSIDQLLVAVRLVPTENLLKIIERILRNVTDNRSGLPDLIVYNDNTFFMAEVKGEKDKLSEQQRDWISFLETIGIKVQLCLVNHTERQIKHLKKKEEENKRIITISFGKSTSKKREQAIEFIKKQTNFSTKGEGIDKIYSAEFDVNDIENLYTMLDLTSGWKSQKIEFNGRVYKSTEIRNILWCFRKKKQLGAGRDYCKQGEYDDKKNKFNCKMVGIDIDRWTKYGYINTDSGEWIFDKKELEKHIDNIIERLSCCPLFNVKKIKNIINKLPDSINPEKDKEWSYISSNSRKWFNHNGKWYTLWGYESFPGIASMVGVEKITKKEINDALKYLNNDHSTINISYGRHETRKNKSGCFIATAVYGDYDALEVKILRKFRDKTLNRNFWGRWFIRTYYFLSPPFANWLIKHKKISNFIKILISRFVDRLQNNY